MTLCGNELCSHQQCATMRRDKRRAEWRLNAAAADLLEACKESDMQIQNAQALLKGFAADSDQWAIALMDQLSAASDANRAAIAKAERVQPPVCYVNSETDCDGELHTCENCGRTMCFSHSAQCSDYSGEHVTYCAECAGRP